MKNRTLAIPAALAAMPPKPKIAAIIAITRKIIVQRNIIKVLKGDETSCEREIIFLLLITLVIMVILCQIHQCVKRSL